MVIHTYFCTKGYDYVKRFVRVLVLVVINTGCPKKFDHHFLPQGRELDKLMVQE